MLIANKPNNVSIKQNLIKECSAVCIYLKQDIILYVIILIFTLFTYLFSHHYGYEKDISLTLSYVDILQVIVAATVGVFVLGYGILLLIRREKHPVTCCRNKLEVWFGHRAKLISVLIFMLVFSYFMSSYSTLKSLIPLVEPFKYDELFYHADRWLFSGNEPWKWFHHSVNSPYITFILNVFYHVWFLLLWGVLLYFLIFANSNQRIHYVASFLLCWALLGSILALLMSSAGPAFTMRLDAGNQHYTELMALLTQQSEWLKVNSDYELWALNVQNDLWDTYLNKKEMLGSGISAMPSMHVSIAVLMALGMSSVNRWAGALFWLFAAVIYIGSFALGWHYAVDGLVSAPLTYLLWRVCAKLTPVSA